MSQSEQSNEPRFARKISLAAPAYNEEAGIADVVREWHAAMAAAGIAAEFVICNDGSTDRTGQVLSELSRDVPGLRVVGGGTNHGYGHALTSAIAACRGEYIATIDSDGQFDPADIPAFLRAIEAGGCDAAVGYRVQKRDTPLRVIADRALNRIVRFMFGTRLRDTNCALKVVRRELLQSLRLEASGFPLPTEMCVKLEAAGARCVECPVRHRERAAGESKLKVWRTGWRMMRFLLYLHRRRRLFRRGILREF